MADMESLIAKLEADKGSRGDTKSIVVGEVAGKLSELGHEALAKEMHSFTKMALSEKGFNEGYDRFIAELKKLKQGGRRRSKKTRKTKKSRRHTRRR